jgi:hypothetical protein
MKRAPLLMADEGYNEETLTLLVDELRRALAYEQALMQHLNGQAATIGGAAGLVAAISGWFPEELDRAARIGGGPLLDAIALLGGLICVLGAIGVAVGVLHVGTRVRRGEMSVDDPFPTQDHIALPRMDAELAIFDRLERAAEQERRRNEFRKWLLPYAWLLLIVGLGLLLYGLN